MHLELSPKSAARLFNRKMSREGYLATIHRSSDRVEVIICHLDRAYNTMGNYSLRAHRNNLMGPFNSPVYDIRASRIMRDTARALRAFTDPVERQRAADAARSAEMRAEMRDKYRAMMNRDFFFGGR
jgi:hypothetical protein